MLKKRQDPDPYKFYKLTDPGSPLLKNLENFNKVKLAMIGSGAVAKYFGSRSATFDTDPNLADSERLNG
jgi:hypothetical protein